MFSFAHSVIDILVGLSSCWVGTVQATDLSSITLSCYRIAE